MQLVRRETCIAFEKLSGIPKTEHGLFARFEDTAGSFGGSTDPPEVADACRNLSVPLMQSLDQRACGARSGLLVPLAAMHIVVTVL